MSDKIKLTAISGNRAALEFEALRSIATDFDKFLAISRSLAPAANGALQLVEATEKKKDKSEPK